MGFDGAKFHFTCDYCGRKETVVEEDKVISQCPRAWFWETLLSISSHSPTENKLFCSTDCLETFVEVLREAKQIAANHLQQAIDRTRQGEAL